MVEMTLFVRCANKPPRADEFEYKFTAHRLDA
jgi:hypothetical protein